ncbi:hypothetical protein QBC35DRAFT_487661 [Podospora australis]|uniref:Uncharacterized protein n=1 Tax=Podospora australis TaxID=1536484 RepID=A0AAN7AMT9_9PEZI|nr:hypothetical protein QBC35DRAFT_487661 [Podospora australis]
MGLLAYSLHDNEGGWVYDNILYIQNNRNFNYFFTDGTGDTYELSTNRLGVHYVRYNSRSPGIVSVRARNCTRGNLPVI